MKSGLSILFGAALLAQGVAQAADQAPAVAAKVNGQTISEGKLSSSYEAFMKGRKIDPARLTPEQVKQAKRGVLEALISQELLGQEATKKKIAVSDDEVQKTIEGVRKSLGSEKAFDDRIKAAGFTPDGYTADVRRRLAVRRLIQDEISGKLAVSEKEVHKFYTENPASFTIPKQHHLRHILIKAGKDASEADQAKAKKKAEEVLAKAKAGEDFAELAKKYSEGPTATKGGDLGFVVKGQMVKPFEEAGFALKPGEVSDVVKTQFGYHVIRLDEVRGGDQVPEAKVSDRIRKYLMAVKTQERLKEHLTDLRNSAKVEILVDL